MQLSLLVPHMDSGAPHIKRVSLMKLTMSCAGHTLSSRALARTAGSAHSGRFLLHVAGTALCAPSLQAVVPRPPRPPRPPLHHAANTQAHGSAHLHTEASTAETSVQCRHVRSFVAKSTAAASRNAVAACPPTRHASPMRRGAQLAGKADSAQAIAPGGAGARTLCLQL